MDSMSIKKLEEDLEQKTVTELIGIKESNTGAAPRRRMERRGHRPWQLARLASGLDEEFRASCTHVV